MAELRDNPHEIAAGGEGRDRIKPCEGKDDDGNPDSSLSQSSPPSVHFAQPTSTTPR